nr:hypothetical protein [Mesorhizobium sp.]
MEKLVPGTARQRRLLILEDLMDTSFLIRATGDRPQQLELPFRASVRPVADAQLIKSAVKIAGRADLDEAIVALHEVDNWGVIRCPSGKPICGWEFPAIYLN